MDEVEDSPERGSQSRQVRQRRNPDNISELTSIRELLQEVTQDTHEGRHQVFQTHIFLTGLPATLALRVNT